MKAMILAAGLGTRLRPLTNDRPKALVEVAGRTLLELALVRLRAFGVRDVIVNVYHFADMIQDYLKREQNFGMNVALSVEPTLLDTGGGLKKAAHFFLEGSSAREEPFLLHNVDVISTIDLERMERFHIDCNALATLAVQQRESSRQLLFDQNSGLCGRRVSQHSQAEVARAAKQTRPLAFCGIHVISPRFLERMTEEGAFSIIDSYLRVAAQGEKVLAFHADEFYWRDLGKPESIARADEDLREARIRL
jgi:NDP-sugar pyrophosphorylase family protein